MAYSWHLLATRDQPIGQLPKRRDFPVLAKVDSHDLILPHHEYHQYSLQRFRLLSVDGVKCGGKRQRRKEIGRVFGQNDEFSEHPMVAGFILLCHSK